MDILKPFISRKFALALLVAVLGTLAVPDVAGEAKLEFLKWLFGLYAGANVAQKATAK